MESGNKKRTPLETRSLILQLEESPCLWNIFHKDYKSKGMKATALTKIAKSLYFIVERKKTT
jgi:hypothetical protein